MNGSPPNVSIPAATQAAAPINLYEVRDLLIQARNENNAVNEQIPHAVELVRLWQDTGHLKLFVYGLAASMVILLATGWQLFLFLDGKIERKADYLNARIDNIHQGQLMQQQYPVPIQSTNNANNAEGALSEDSLPTNGSKIIQKTE